MHYDFEKIEKKWQKYWADHKTFRAETNPDKEKFYVLDMFPYPSGSGLHVGHPLGYIASDIYARYKRHKGLNVLHPMGYDSFGLPAEQYAIQTGQHPKNTTEINIEGCLDDKGNILPKYVNEDGNIKNAALIDKSKPVTIEDADYRDNIIKGYRRQLDQLGFSFDWSREIRTSDPKYYKWTQWIFIQLFNAWYNTDSDRAEDIEDLISIFERDGNTSVNAVCDEDTPDFSARDWKAFASHKKQEVLLKYRLTYLADAEVNWCPALGTVLANDEIVNGVSERGGHPVVRKKMTQWMMRITAYAQRLLDGLDTIDWPQPLKDAQRNWIGRSEGASVTFRVLGSDSMFIEVFTTRPDTIFGTSFMTLAPEHELVSKITTSGQKAEVEAYVAATAKRSERDRMADVKTITGAFTGAYAEHPFTKEPIPIWIGDYVLAGYGTGAVMSVPCGDQRDHDFARHFGIDIPNIFEGIEVSEEAFADKEKTIIANSDFLNGLSYRNAVKKAIAALEKIGQGKGKVNYRLRDAVFSRQRYWGEPFPVYYVDGMPQMIEEAHLPLRLPEVDKYLPTETGEPPLGNATEWAWDTNRNEVVANRKITPSARPTNENVTPSTHSADKNVTKGDLPSDGTVTPGTAEGSLEGNGVYPLELNTMPGWAGSSQYFNRYMEPDNKEEIFSQEAITYWQDVDLYIGGSEHATGHLLYSRFWQKFMFDKGLVPVDEYARKLINQGMITGTSAFAYAFDGSYVSKKPNTTVGTGFGKLLISYSKGKLISENLEVFSALWLEKALTKNENIDKFNITEELFDLIVELYNELKTAVENLGQLSINWNPYQFSLRPIRVDVSLVGPSDDLDIKKFKSDKRYFDFKEAEFVLEDTKFIVDREVEKMSKSKYNVVNPDDICEEYGADSLRLYEMFLGPLEQSKPWNTAGITGVHGFLKKLWKLYHSGPDHKPSPESLKTLHKTIKKVEEDIENFSFNTTVSTFMICVNELTAQKCTSGDILEPLTILISPYAPHIAEELWEKLGHTQSISTASFPKFEEKYLVESSKEYPISFNGKMRFTIELPLDMDKQQIEDAVLAHERTQQQLDGRTPKKVIVVPGKIVNIVG